MKTIVTFQFDSIEEAQEFLRAGAGPKPSTPVTVETAAEKKERKARSDAGQPRGPYKRKDELPVEAAAQAKDPAETPPAAPAAAAVPDEQSLPSALTIQDVRAAMTGRATEQNIGLLKKFGYARSSDLPQAKYADFIAACKRGEG